MRSFAISIIALFATAFVSLGATTVSAAPEIETNPTAKTVKVESGDSLSTIASRNQSTAQRLYDANTSVSDPNLIFAGNELKVPAKDETLPTRPFPVAVVATTAPVAESVPAQESTASVPAAPVAAGGSVWDSLAACESGGNWSINTGNGFYGGLQFTQSSWNAVGGSGLPSNASRDEQIMRGQMLQARQGWGAWPACTAKLGLR